MNPEHTHKRSRAVVTGASGGIGEHLARGLARRGHSLMLIARRADRLRLLADELEAQHGITVELWPCDLTDRQARVKLLEALASREVDVLCNNAGFATFGGLGYLEPRREIEQLELNAVALHELTLVVLPGMLSRNRGRILITGSTAGHQPMPGSATYSASKAFANTFAESLHQELQDSNVACSLLAPGPVRTGFSSVAGIAALEGRGGDFAWLEAGRVAEEALQGLEQGKRIIVPGVFAKLETIGGRYTPRAILLPLLNHFLRRLTHDPSPTR